MTATLTHTFTRTYHKVTFANPYLRCLEGGEWVDGFLRTPEDASLSPLTPCMHRSDYRDLCPSWGPVDGCTCAAHGLPAHAVPPTADAVRSRV